MKKLSLTCILILGVILISGCTNEEKTNSVTPIQTISQNDEVDNGQIPQGTPIGDIKQGEVADFYDKYGNRVNPDDIIVVGKMPLQTALDGPIRLVREGLIDIEVKLGGKMPPFEVTKVNKIPDTSKKRTFLRAKLYDEKGNVVRFKMTESQYQVDYYDYYEVGPLREGGATYTIYDEAPKAKEVEIFIYFIDSNKIPTPVPQKTINI